MDERGIRAYTLSPVENAKKRPFYAVLNAVSRATGETFTAYRSIRRSLENTCKVLEIESEIEILGSINHPNIQKLYDIIVEGDSIFIILEYENKTILSIFEGGITYDEGYIKGIFRQIAEAISYLHGESIAHLDIRPENIIITKDGQIKLSKFFYARRIKDKYLDIYGTLNYQAPEVSQGAPYDPFKADVWACGAVLFFLLTSRMLIPGDSEEIVSRSIVSLAKEQKVPYPNHLSSSAKSLLDGMLSQNPQKRFTINDALQSEWLRI